MRHNPYAVIEGLLVAAHSVGALEAYIALKASFEPELARVGAAVEEMAAAGWLEGLNVTVVTGPEEYLFGEEKALLEVIEGNEPLPRWLPPFLHGLFATAPQLGWESAESEPGHEAGHESNPTLVNNAETLAQAAWIVAHGAEAFRSLGTDESPGTVVCTVVGDVLQNVLLRTRPYEAVRWTWASRPPGLREDARIDAERGSNRRALQHLPGDELPCDTAAHARSCPVVSRRCGGARFGRSLWTDDEVLYLELFRLL